MPNLHVILPLQNESSSPVEIQLEPLPEYYIIQPGQKVEIHGVCADTTENRTFTVAPGDSCLTIYAPGQLAGFVHCYVTCNGVRLKPDGN